MNQLLGQDVPTASSPENLTQRRPTIVDLFQKQVSSSAFSTALEVNNNMDRQKQQAGPQPRSFLQAMAK
jgi:hypothetical protein